MIRFDEQVAVVTGSGRGLGAAYATLLAARGAAVIVHDAGVSPEGIGADPTVADAVVQTITAAHGTAVANYEPLDTTEGCERVIAAALSQFGRVDMLIHNAGLVAFADIDVMDEGLFERMLNINVRAAFWLARAVFPSMKQQHYGRIVFTTSGRAMYLESALPGLTCYTLGKLAQVGLMHSLAAEGAAWNIRVNAIAPVAATRMLRRQVAPGTFCPEHVAPGVAFLASGQCEQSGIILQAGNRHFSTARYARGQEITLAPEALTPEAIADQWQALLAPPA